MTEVLIAPDATEAAILYLRSQLVARSDTAVVGNAVPKGRGRFVTISRVGGGRRQHVIDDAVLAVHCWAPTKQQATDLAQLCRGFLGAMPGNVANVILVSDSDFSDEEDALSDQPFSPFAITVSMRCTALSA